MGLSPETSATHVRARVTLWDYSSQGAARSSRPAPATGSLQDGDAGRARERLQEGPSFLLSSISSFETVNKILHLHFKDDKTRVSSDALLLMAEMLNVFVREAAARGARQAQAEDLDRVDIEHVEKVLPQLKLHVKDPARVPASTRCPVMSIP
ncbi:centromere protein X isoform X2 [Dermochelys coriacea]|uniref:centromere protein X isoform X2 n=1 Tax=Dermochelys coriacea TaxID=27794 RepID=UPI001CA85C1E|nr:centromere protein X isoform X2 [Dermochelys coriacea]